MGVIRDTVTAVTLSILLLHSRSSNAFVSQPPVGVWGGCCSRAINSDAGVSKPTARTTASTTSRYSSVLQDRLSGEDIQARLQQQLAKLKEKDLASRTLSKEELNIVFEDDHIIVVDKPSGVLCVPSQGGVPSLAQTVFDYCQSKGAAAAEGDTELVTKMDQMVVHRLGMDTSGLVVFAKTMDAVRGMNALFRTRKITRQYQALVAGHVQKDQGLINLPLMRCYEHPPYMRISTDEHQRALIDLDVTVVGSKLLEAPKTSLTHYSVVSRETYANNDDLPVTQLTLTSISGRTHQLNVHCAAVGHAIVGDTVYGWNGQAAANGGLETSTALDAASAELQEKIAAAAEGKSMCVHAKMVRFRHPITKEEVEFTSASPF